MRIASMAIAAGVMLASTLAAAATPGAGITGTAHDFSAAGGTSLLQWLDSKGAVTTYNTGTPNLDPVTGKQTKTTVTLGQCTKCHTPHQAKSTNLLWNHTLQSTSYSWNVPATTAGTTYATFKGDTYKGPTTKCLSCHDGLMASTDGMWFNRQVTAGSKYVAPAGSLNSGHEVSAGADMSGTHPVAMPYPFNGAQNQYNFVKTGDNFTATDWVADPMSTNKIRLFKDDGTGNITAGTLAGNTGIECTSCHDVHNGSRVKDVMLLTGQLTGSDRSPGGYICTQCHAK